MNILKKVLNVLISPSSIGIILTLMITYGSLKYYTYRAESDFTDNLFYQIFTWIDQKANDFRLLDRGEREGSEDVVILAIDDYSIEKIGRWPWSRDIIANLVNELKNHQAKIIAFDVIFSEEDNNKTLSTLQKIKNTNPTTIDTLNALEHEIEHANTDQVLIQTIENNAETVVMGVYFDPQQFWLFPYQHSCAYVAYSRTRAFNYWDNEASLIVADPYDIELPEPFRAALEQIFILNQEQMTEEFINELNIQEEDLLAFNEKQILEFKIYENNLKYCQKWLTSEDPFYHQYESLWPEIQSEYDDYTGLSFNEGIQVYKDKHLKNPVRSVGRWWISFPGLADVTEYSGFFLADLDSDGTIRKSPLFVRSGNQYAPSLALRSYLVANDYQIQVFFDLNLKNQSEKIVKDVRIGDNEGNPLFTIPTDEKGRIIINYAGKRHMFAYLSAAELLSDSPQVKIQKRIYNKEFGQYLSKDIEVNKADFIKGKTFLVGATATGVYDLRVTPFEENFPGVETHANVIDNLIRKDFLRLHPNEELYMIVFLMILGIGLSITLSHLGAVWGLVITTIILSTVYFFDKIYFFKNGYLISVFFPIFLTFSIYLFLTFYKYFTEERKKKELKGTFAKYVSPAIVEEILADPSNIELGGKKENLTVLFSDIRGFTTISEKLDPRALSDLLNSYLTPMTQLVFEHKGTLDKYMGDAVMAFFGAPIHYLDHANHACRCSLEMLVKLNELQLEYKRKGLPNIDIGIGLNSGEMSVGNMGSDIVRSYTVMGDSVNLGARLEGINKQYGTRIIISEFTYEAIKNDFIVREVDWVRVKGKLLPVKIYELVGEHTAPENTLEKLKWFNDGFTSYHEKNFSHATEKFEKALAIQPDDLCSKLYIERCKDYLIQPPPEDWDGVFIMTSK